MWECATGPALGCALLQQWLLPCGERQAWHHTRPVTRNQSTPSPPPLRPTL